MAEAIGIVTKLGSLAFKEIGDALGVKKQLANLNETVKVIQDTLQLLDENRRQGHCVLAGIWYEPRLQDVCYEVREVLDDFEFYHLLKQLCKGSFWASLRQYLKISSDNPTAFRLAMSWKIKKIKASLDRIRNDIDFDLKQGVSGAVRSLTMESFPCIDKSDVKGRYEDTKNIMQFLFDDNVSLDRISTIPIVGIGGIGKTALAFSVYSEERVDKNFKPRLWVAVKLDFNLKVLMRKILESAGQPFDNLNTERLKNEVKETVKDKVFLLVLDGVRSVDQVKWGEFLGLLSAGAPGSKIIVTTRNHSVARAVGPIRPYNLKPLTYEDSWTLFEKWTFAGDLWNSEILMKIGQEIVKKCNGVAGAIRTVARLLAGKSEEHEWLRVRDNDFWKFFQTKGCILPVLRLSYEELPSHLKRCFAYFSTFPKGFEILVIELIHQWIAQEFIQPSGETQELEKVGQEYIHELMSNSFLEGTDGYGYFSTLKMHDLVHELAISVVQKEYSIIGSHVNGDPVNIRHLSFSENRILQKDDVSSQLLELEKVHTAGFQFVGPNKSLVDACISSFKRLRMLGLTHSSFETLPSSIGGLKYLRYLDLSGNRNIESLPNSICRLLFLETLMLQGCVKFGKLPKDVGNLTRLRCLRLTTQERCLSGKLIASLKALQCLWIDGCGNMENLLDNEVIIGNEHVLSTISVLVIENCKNLLSLPLGLNSVSKLESLMIINCEKLDSVMIDKFCGGLKKLRYLWLGELPKLVALPSLLLQGAATTLKHIRITNCSGLTTLPEGLECLRKLWIEGCPQIASLPYAKTSYPATMKELHISKCPQLIGRCRRETGKDWHKISHVYDIYLEGINVQDSINN